MATNLMDESEGYLDRDAREEKIREIARALANVEGKHPQDEALVKLSRKFENRVFAASSSAQQYCDRIDRKLNKVAEIRETQLAQTLQGPATVAPAA